MKARTLTIAIVFFCSVDGDSPDTEGTRRLERAIQLHRDGFVDQIMISGGYHGGVTLGKAYRQYLLAKDVKDSDIIMENESHSTETNIELSFHRLGVIESSGVEIKKIYLVTNFRHLRRINILRRRYYWPLSWNTEGIPIEPDPKVSGAWREFIKLVATILKQGGRVR